VWSGKRAFDVSPHGRAPPPLTTIDSAKIDAFARLMTEKLDNGDTNARRSYIRSISLGDSVIPSTQIRFSVHTGIIVAIPILAGLHHQYVRI
jgi:hypothetical protein